MNARKTLTSRETANLMGVPKFKHTAESEKICMDRGTKELVITGLWIFALAITLVYAAYFYHAEAERLGLNKTHNERVMDEK